MTRWDELSAQIRATYRLVQDEPTWLAMGWTFPGEPPVRQLASVALEEAATRPWLVVGATAGSASRLAHERALTRNAELALGAIALVGGDYVVRFACPLEVATWELVALALRMVVAEAIRIRTGRVDSTTSSTVDAFAAYAD